MDDPSALVRRLRRAFQRHQMPILEEAADKVQQLLSDGEHDAALISQIQSDLEIHTAELADAETHIEQLQAERDKLQRRIDDYMAQSER